MPELQDITYSRQECIAAVRDFYKFLTTLYLDERYIIEPPEDGWPTISIDGMRALGKTDEVILLLRHLPYICTGVERKVQAVPYGRFADWQDIARTLASGHREWDAVRVTTEGAEEENVPAHVVGLVIGGRDSVTFLLDTQLGIIYWPDCPDGPKHHPSREKVRHDPYDWAPTEEEADWRAESPAWAVSDFFEMLKDQYRSLSFVPISGRTVLDVYTIYEPESDGLMETLAGVYRRHGWPDSDQYSKSACLHEVRRVLKDKYPNKAVYT